MWQNVAARDSTRLAVAELGSGREWTFAQLARAADAIPDTDSPLRTPRGHTVDFLLEVLAGWRFGSPVCPLEPDQALPDAVQLPDKIAHLKLTSGSTAAPKLVALTELQLIADVDQIVSTMGLCRESPNLGVISLAHSYGFSNLVLPLFLHGVPLVLGSSPLPAEVGEMARRYPGSTLPAVPALWRTWHSGDTFPRDVRLAISAGASLPLDVEIGVFARHGLKIHNFLGASECGGIAYDRASQPRSEAAQVGTALDGVRLSVDVDGCLEVRSNAVAETYWPEADPRLEGGVYRTRDLVDMHPDGTIRLVGRADDLINVAGRKFSPESIEVILRMHPNVRECIVFGVPSSDPIRGDEVVACVESDEEFERLRQHLLARLPAWQIPRNWWSIESLAPDGRGKLSRTEWRQRWIRQFR